MSKVNSWTITPSMTPTATASVMAQRPEPLRASKGGRPAAARITPAADTGWG
jgi:hypothetical protein